MIRYDLVCENHHRFESWFQNAAAFDSLKAAGHVSCAICGSASVKKALMAPAVSSDHAVAPSKSTATAIEEMRRHVEANSDYVGLSFAQEARDMHDGLIPHRPIYGQAKTEEARKLLEDGVPVLPLPFIPSKKAN